VLPELLDPAEHRIGDFLVILLENRLPNHLGHKEPHRIPGDLILRVEKRAWGQGLFEPFEEAVDPARDADGGADQTPAGPEPHDRD